MATVWLTDTFEFPMLIANVYRKDDDPLVASMAEEYTNRQPQKSNIELGEKRVCKIAFNRHLARMFATVMCFH